MHKKHYLFWGLLTATAAIGYWFHTTYTIIKKTANFTTTVPTETKRLPANSNLPKAESTVSSQPVTETLPTTTSDSEAAIKQQLDLETQKLELQKKTLDALKQRYQLQLQQITSDFPNQINTNSAQIQNLLESLQNQRLAESDVIQSASAILREQSSAERFSRDQVDLQIQNLEQDLARSAEQLRLGLNSTYAYTSEEQDRYTKLQNLFAQQTEQLNLLREQRVNISAAAYLQTKNVTNASLSQKAGLVQTQSELQDQINNLREENIRLQTEYTQSRMSLMPLTQQIQQAEQAYQENENKVKSLQQSTIVR